MSTGVFTDIRSLHGVGPIKVEHDRTRAHPNKFITCGVDGTIYVWDDKTFTAEKSSADVKNVGEQTYAVATWLGNNVYFGYLQLDLISGIEKKRVGMANFDDLEEVTPLMTFNLEPTSIDVSDTFLVCGTSEFTIKLMKLVDRIDLATVDVNGEVLCVKIDPKQEYLAASISDGSVVIFNLKEATTEEVPEVANISRVFPSINTITVEFPRGEMVWSPDGKYIYVPHTGGIKIISKENWTALPDGFKASGRELDAFSICTLSPNGKILAACTVNRHICFWNTSDLSCISQYEFKRNCPGKTFITSMNFALFDERSIIITDSNEGMCLLKNAVSLLEVTAGEKAANVEISKKKDRKRILDSDDEDEDKRPVEVFLDDAADEDTNMSEDIGAIKKQYGFSNQPTLDDFFGPEGERRTSTDYRNLDAISPAHVVQKVTQVVEYIPPTIPAHFTSGASPRNLSSRYLKWNAFGIIRSIREDDVNNIEIEYHDKDVHSEMVFDNTANYCMGDLTDEAIALANVVEGEEEQSELWVYHVTAWDGTNRKWTTNLPPKDYPIDILVSQKLIGVLTILRNLRIFTLQGTQRHIIAHPGPSLTACCFDTKFAIVSFSGSEYYEKTGKDNAQYNYTVSIYNLDPQRWYHNESNVSTNNIAVKPGQTITWVGYTNSGNFCVADNSVRLLTRGGIWIPIFDGDSVPRSKSDALWPISVIDGAYKQIRYLYCRGSKYPIMALKLAPTIVPWTLPLCHTESDKTKYEQELFFNELDQNEAILTGADVNRLLGQHLQCIVHLFALACKMGRDTRAWELAQLVPSAKGIQGLVNFANKTGRSVLGEKVAAYGRENMLGDVATTSYKSISQSQQELLGPKQVVMSKRSVRETTVMLNSQQDIFEDSERDSLTPLPENTQQTDTSLFLDTSLNIPNTRNPFKRSLNTSQRENSQSLFDKLDESFDNPRKRAREETIVKPSTVRQTKLDFSKGKENKINYQDWLEDNEDRLKKTFSGDVSDFDKFCIGQFRIFSNSQKKKAG